MISACASPTEWANISTREGCEELSHIFSAQAQLSNNNNAGNLIISLALDLSVVPHKGKILLNPITSFLFQDLQIAGQWPSSKMLSLLTFKRLSVQSLPVNFSLNSGA